MVKSELVQKLTTRSPHLYQCDLERVVNVVLDKIVSALKSGDRVELRGFGAFTTKERTAHTGRTPHTRTAVTVALAILMFFISIGHQLLNALHIPMASFQLAGSLMLLIFRLQMTLEKVSETVPMNETRHSFLQRAISPLATTCIAGSGWIMTVIMLTDNVERSFAEIRQTVLVLCICFSILLAALSLVGSISRFLGRRGIEVISRVFGLILTSIAVTNIIIAIMISFGLN